MKHLIALSILFIVTACSSVVQTDHHKLRRGMSKSEVEDIIGIPYVTSITRSGTIYVYRMGYANLDVQFKDNQLVRTSQDHTFASYRQQQEAATLKVLVDGLTMDQRRADEYNKASLSAPQTIVIQGK